MPTEPSTLKLTYEDYVLLTDDGNRHEIIDGEEYVSPAPITPHQRAIVRLAVRLFACVEEQGLGEVFVSPVDVILTPTDIVQPGVVFVAGEKAGLVARRGIEGAPDLVVEVLSDGTRRHDEIPMRKLYERHGVSEYWIVDPEVETVEVYPTEAGRYVRRWNGTASTTTCSPR